MNAIRKPLKTEGANPGLALLIKRYFRFGVVGGSGIAVDMAALFILGNPRMLGLDLSLSKALAAEIAILWNFTWNELWTFRDLAVNNSCAARTLRFGKFNLICLAGIGLSVLLLNVETRCFQMNMYLGNLVAILIVSFWNFGLNLRFGWRPGGKP